MLSARHAEQRTTPSCNGCDGSCRHCNFELSSLAHAKLGFESTMDTTDPPCSFDVFVAQRRGISYEQAERLVQYWLEHYRPRAKREAQFQGTSRDTACA